MKDFFVVYEGVPGQAHQHTQNHPDLVFAPSGINTEPAKRHKH